MGYTPIIEFGENTLVLDEHFFDVYGKISLGNGSWIAGHGSQFWTHGLSVQDRDINIGQKNYIGTAVLFAPGTSIGSNNVVALGSVVMSKLSCNASLISGNPAKPFRSIEEDQKNGKYRFDFDDWSD
jgi:acetyltransferase-like isoleucine patch superfamily enzyme